MTKRLTIALVALAMFLLLVVMPVSAGYYTVSPVINRGATVYIGEQGLDITNAMSLVTSKKIGWWASAAQLGVTSPTKSIDLTDRVGPGKFTVAPSDFVGFTGDWYGLLASGAWDGNSNSVFNVADPQLDVKIFDPNQNADVTGKSVPQGTRLWFDIQTNMYTALNTPLLRGPVLLERPNDRINPPQSANYYGYLDIKVKDESGATLNALLNNTISDWQVTNPLDPYFGVWLHNGVAVTIVNQNVSYQPWKWGQAPGSLYIEGYDTPAAGAHGIVNDTTLTDPITGAYITGWATGALDRNGQYAYPAGTYTVSVESKLNNMKDNYKNAGADYTGKTVTQAYTVTLVSDTVKIEANKDSVVRSKPFSVTVTGRPSTVYHLWVKGTSSMTGGYDDQPPMMKKNQEGVLTDLYGTGNPNVFPVPDVSLGDSWPVPGYLGKFPWNAGGYQWQNGGGDRVWTDVAHGSDAYNRAILENGTLEYANITTTTSGVRTVEFTTTNWTKAQKYTIRVEQLFGTQYKTDEVDVNVEKGAVTIVAAGDQSYYLGEEIKFSGTNTETYRTYLFIIGPNLPTQGSDISDLDPRNDAVVNNDPEEFAQADVLGDNTWSWKWGTAKVALDAGTYTIYAVSQPYDRNNLDKAAYGTVSIIIKKPFVSATASQSTVAKGDRIYITGTAEGQPSSVQIWILGKNLWRKATEAVNADSSFKYEVKQEFTRDLYSGQYFVVVQHPMQNKQFDIDTITIGTGEGSATWVENLMLIDTTTLQPTRLFKLGGSGSLQGSDAAEALVQGINDPNVDDTYTKLQFLVEEPVIRIDPIGDKHVGDKFTITAQTNLAVDDEILVQVYSSSFKPTQKSQSGEFSGATGTVKVTQGDGGMNKISFDIDSSTFKPDEYIVTESAVIQDATGTALFNVLEPSPTTVATPVVTAAATTAATLPPTTIATAVVPVKTTTPGYGALIALIGLGAVAFIVVRRH